VSAVTDQARPHDLRVDHLVAPLGVDGPPRLSWMLPAGATAQRAYRIEAGGWDSGRVDSGESTFVPVGVAPASGLRVEWRVKTWTDLGESDWSEPGAWEHGLLAASDWAARWIAPVEAADVPPRQRPAYQLAGGVPIDGEIARARLHATAHGIYEAFVNGRRVGTDELAPGWTAYRRRLHVQTHDVTDLLVPGDNVVGALLSDGWWRGQNSVARRVDDYGPTTALLMQLVVTLASGETLTFGTGEAWRSVPSHVLRADLVAGEVHDLRRRVGWRGWPGWSPVRIEDNGHDRLAASPAPPVRRVEELRPVSVRPIGRGRWVVDVGQNITGWIRLARLGPAGTEIALTYGEWLDAAGDVTQDNVAHATSEVDRSVTFQVDTVTSAGVDGDVFEPRHSTKGFQYVRVEGYDGPLTADDVTAVVVHTGFDRRGAFSCSDARVEAIHRLADWSFRGNACDIPTDCPTRERAGWTGDWQIYVETAALLYDVGGFSVKWLRDLAAEQRPDGKVTNLVPESHPGDGRPPPFWPALEGSSGWGDAAVHVPWEVYRATGDRRVLAEQWPSASAWVDFAARAAAGGRHPSRVERSADPLPHERYLWDTGWHFGEWLEAGEQLDDAIARAMTADHGSVATAYLYRSASEVAEIARVLDRPDDADRYSSLATDVAGSWRREFLADDGTTTPDTQATYARALTFGLIPDELRTVSAARLVELIRAAGTHLGTGFLATPFLLPVLADHGHLDVAYELLLQDTEPSWLTMVDRGATTVWEEWGGVDETGAAHASLNHYSKGAVVSFLHHYVAGLQVVDPAYRRFRVAPLPGGGLTWAEASHHSPYGRIAVRWDLDGESLTVRVTVPPSTEAEVALPSGTTRTLGPGDHEVAV
jgi:alpha-L-rhamnosidase